MSDNIAIWQDLIRHIPAAVIIIDDTEIAIIENAAARELLGKSMVGRSVETLSRDPELLAAIERAFLSGTSSATSFHLRAKSDRQLEATVGALGGGTSPKQPRHVVLTLRDTSQQMRLLEMRSDFIANASHELRTPLASLRGFIETLQGPASSDEKARTRFLGIMAAQAERMTRLIDDLLLLSRVEERAFLAPTTPVDVTQIIEDVIDSLSLISAERNITITFPEPTAPLLLAGDRDELFQVFQNLIENAVKYGRDGGHVTVSAAMRQLAQPSSRQQTAAGTITVVITDNGEGIAPEHLPRLTERFYRVNADQSRKVGGTGLGLAIVKHVLARHGGTVRFESTVGSGTTATVELAAQNK